MTQNHTIIKLTQDELEALRMATRERFSDENRISRGAMIQLLSEESVDE